MPDTPGGAADQTGSLFCKPQKHSKKSTWWTPREDGTLTSVPVHQPRRIKPLLLPPIPRGVNDVWFANESTLHPSNHIAFPLFMDLTPRSPETDSPENCQISNLGWMSRNISSRAYLPSAKEPIYGYASTSACDLSLWEEKPQAKRWSIDILFSMKESMNHTKRKQQNPSCGIFIPTLSSLRPTGPDISFFSERDRNGNWHSKWTFG